MIKETENSQLYPWGRNRPFNDFSGFFKTLFKDRVQKISIDAGFTCPNRDGFKGVGGCSFCDNKTFNPSYCVPKNSVTEQLNQGISFFKKRYPGQQYLAYFQAYTNTYASLDHLQALYEEALAHSEVIGLVIGTRPDCISEELLEYLDQLANRYFISLEFGIESTSDRTLERINRGHDFAAAVQALKLCESYSFFTGVHMIMGLPGETEKDLLSHAEKLNGLKFDFLKLHQMQIIKGTRMEQEYVEKKAEFIQLTSEAYIDFVIRFLERLNPAVIIERFISESPPEKLIAPKWGLKNFEFVSKLENEMLKRRAFQGRLL